MQTFKQQAAMTQNTGRKRDEWQRGRGVATDFLVGGGGRIVGRWLTYPQNTLKSKKVPDLGHFILESGGDVPS